ncbi:MAG: gas vesicle protein GvpD P-loop domain-containing protein [Thermoplasmata archaeon]
MSKVLPSEIYDFFDSDSGRSLIIKGHAGIGKTILSLTLLEEIGEVENSFYFSTRVSNKSLYSQFGWLKEKDMRENLVDTSMEFLRTIYPIGSFETKKPTNPVDEREYKVEKAKSVLNVLDERSPDVFTLPNNVSRTFLLSLMGDSDIRALEEIYDRVDSLLPSPCLIIIDSLESLIERYGVDTTSLIKALQKDLVELSGTKLLCCIID